MSGQTLATTVRMSMIPIPDTIIITIMINIITFRITINSILFSSRMVDLAVDGITTIGRTGDCFVVGSSS